MPKTKEKFKKIKAVVFNRDTRKGKTSGDLIIKLSSSKNSF